MKIDGLLQPEDIIAELSAETKEAVLQELAAKASERHAGLDREEVLKVLLEREKLGSTGIGNGVALPHGRLRSLEKPLLVFGRSPKGVEFDALDNRKANLFFLLVAPESAVGVHLRILARISRILKDPDVRKGLLEALDAAAIFDIIREQDSRQ